MPTWRSTVLEPDGQTAVVTLDAVSPEALEQSLQDSGRLLIEARPVKRKRATQGRVIPPKKLLVFTQSMESLLEGGVPILVALEAVKHQEQDPALVAVLDGIMTRIEQGEAIADAFAAYPRSFGTLYTELLRAGESSGRVDGAFQSLGHFLSWMHEIRGVIKQAIVYPIVVLAASYGLIMFMLAYVIPRLASVIEGLTSDMPASSRFLFSISGFVAEHVTWILLGTLASIIGFRMFMKSATGQAFLVQLLSKTPGTRGIVVAINRAQMCRTLSVLLAAGLTITKAVRQTSRMVTLPWMSEDLRNAEEGLMQGQSLTEVLRGTAVLPDFGLVMLKAGEESGGFERSFSRLASIYDSDAKSEVKRAIALLEPAMTAVLGVIIASVAVVVVKTIYSAVNGLANS